MKNVSAPARHLIRAAVLILTAVVPACAYAYLHSRVIVSSDTTTTLPMASDILAGNVWLKNWILGSNNFYFTEILVYCLGRLAGLSFCTLIVWIPSLALGLTFSLLLAFLLPELARYKRVFSYIIFALLFVSVLIVVPYQSSYTLLNANSHNNLYAGVALCLLLVSVFLSGRFWALPVLILLGSLLCFSEGVTVMVLVGPLVLFGLLHALCTKQRRPLLLTLSGALMYAGGKGISDLFSHMGGLVTRGLPMHLLAPEGVPARIPDWAEQFGVLLDAPLVSSHVTVRTTLVRVLALLYAAALVYGIIRFFRLSWRRQLMLLTALLNIGGCLFTDVAISHRYIVPAFYFGFLLLFLFICDAAERILTHTFEPDTPVTAAHTAGTANTHVPAGLPGSFSFWRAAAGLLVPFCLVSSVSFGADKCAEFASQPILGQDEQRLADFISKNRLGDGYANFWNASVIAYYADFDFQVYPVYTGTGSGTFIAYPELIRRDWYAECGIHYFVLHEGEDSDEIRKQVLAIAGEPDSCYDFGDYELLWYDRDLSAHLTNGLYDNVLTADELIPATDTGVYEEDTQDIQGIQDMQDIQDMQGIQDMLDMQGMQGIQDMQDMLDMQDMQGMQGRCWVLPDGGSVGAYGVSLAPGTWRLTFHGSSLKDAAILVTSDKLGELGVICANEEIQSGEATDENALPEGSTSITAADSETVSLTVRLPKAVEDITITVQNLSGGDGKDVRLNRITAEKL